MKIRKAEIADVSKLVGLNRVVQEVHADAFPERFRRAAPEQVVADAFTAMIESPSSCWLVAEAEGRLVGFLSAEFREREESWCVKAHRVCYVAGIVVAREFRRRGIARALLAELRQEAAVRGVTGIELDVWAFNREAREAFARLGFKPLMERMVFESDASKCE